MSGIRRKALLLAVAVVSGTMLMTACEGGDGANGSDGARRSSAGKTSGGSDSSDSQNGGKTSDDDSGKDDGGAAGEGGSGVDTGDGKRVPVEQGCGANDISWTAKSETQAGGYILISAKAKPGITCYLPAGLPTVAFGSDGTEAGPAEQAAGEQIKLSGATTAYAGVNPKTTSGNGGKELDSIIVGVGSSDPNPVSLKVGTITVDAPVVTNWHTVPTEAIPFG